MAKKGEFKHTFPATGYSCARTKKPPNERADRTTLVMATEEYFPALCRVNGIEFISILSFKDASLAKKVLGDGFVGWPQKHWDTEDDYLEQINLRKRTRELRWLERGHDLKDLEILTKPTNEPLRKPFPDRRTSRSLISS